MVFVEYVLDGELYATWVDSLEEISECEENITITKVVDIGNE